MSIEAQSDELLVTFEVFKEKVSIWLNQGSCQFKLDLPLQEGLSLASWLLEESTEAWPSVGLPLPGSNLQDYFMPEDKPIAEAAFGFKGANLKAFKFVDIEYNAKALEIELGCLQMTFLHGSLEAWFKAASAVIHYKDAD